MSDQSVTIAYNRDHLPPGPAQDAVIRSITGEMADKGFLVAANTERPFLYRPIRSFEEVSRSLVGDLLNRVFGGSREQLLVQVLGGRKKLTAKERSLLEQVLKEQDR